ALACRTCPISWPEYGPTESRCSTDFSRPPASTGPRPLLHVQIGERHGFLGDAGSRLSQGNDDFPVLRLPHSAPLKRCRQAVATAPEALRTLCRAAEPAGHPGEARAGPGPREKDRIPG